MAEKRKFYKLGGNASNFFDPTQSKPENQTLKIGDVKELETTPRVSEWRQGGGLVVLSEAEAKEEMEHNEQLREQIKRNDSAQKKLNSAAVKETEASKTLAEANAKLKVAEDKEADYQRLKTEVERLTKELQQGSGKK